LIIISAIGEKNRGQKNRGRFFSVPYFSIGATLSFFSRPTFSIRQFQFKRASNSPFAILYRPNTRRFRVFFLTVAWPHRGHHYIGEAG
jgi:hypothetical protein